MGILDDNARGDLSDEMADLCAKLPIHVVVKVDRAPTDQASDVAPVQRRCNSRNIKSQYMKDHWYLNCEAEWYEDMIQWSSQLIKHALRSCKSKAWQQQQQQKGLSGIRAHDLCYTGAPLYQLSYQTN